jgi:hypothetical protein
VENELLIKHVYINHTVEFIDLKFENKYSFFLDDHPDVKIQPPVWFCYEYNIRIFGNGMKILDGSKIKIQVEK